MTRSLAALLTLVGVAAYQPPVPVASAGPVVEIALVANAEAGTVAFVDVGARDRRRHRRQSRDERRPRARARRTIAQDTDVSPDGRTLYVSRGYLGDVAAFDIASGRLLWQRSLDTGRADHMTLTPDGRSLFVSAMIDNRVYKIATATGEITGHFVTGVYPHDNKVSKDGRRLYNTSLGAARGAAAAAERAAADRDAGQSVPVDHRRRRAR